MESSKYAFELGFFAGLHKRMPRDLKVAAILAQLYTESGQVDEGLKMDRKLVRLNPNDATAHYNLGCSLALKGRKSDAMRAIRSAVSLGYKDYHWMRNDPDLEHLQDYKPFRELLQELEVG
ncbi:MAG: tetratricopeptide repeat protein [Verrucomicrobia bacterium]|nr:tetratricopeptide repeat protein [Verrucomicrobiota bacterium]